MTFAEREPILAARVTEAVVPGSAFVLDMTGAFISPTVFEIIEEAVAAGATSVLIQNFRTPCE